MWEALKNIATSVKDTLGIEVPDLPVDLGAIGETASGLVEGVPDQVSEAISGMPVVPDVSDLSGRR
jgi:hypothetical protein